MRSGIESSNNHLLSDEKNYFYLNSMIEQTEKIIFSDKVSKFNPYGWVQDRIIVVTNKNIYNVKKKSIQRKISLALLKAITKSLDPNSKEIVFHIPEEYDYRYIIERKDELINALMGNENPYNIQLFGVPHPKLDEFTTSQKEASKKICKIPHDQYLLNRKSFKLEQDHFLLVSDQNKCLTIYQRNNPSKLILLSEFNIIQLIGKGACGVVFLAQRKDKKEDIIALKQLKKGFLLENGKIIDKDLPVYMLQKSIFPFLVNIEYIFKAPDNLYIGYNYFPGGELYYHLSKEKRFLESRIKFYGAQIIYALIFLHSKKMIYRNLYPENILMDSDGYLGLSDYGLMNENNITEEFLMNISTPEYVAPEMIKCEKLTKAIDWWMFGILLYEMAVGIPPFYHPEITTLYMFICNETHIFPDPCKFNIIISNNLKDLIDKLLQKDPLKRLGNLNDDEVLNHPFFSDFDFSKIISKEIVPEFIPSLPSGALDTSNYLINSYIEADEFPKKTNENQINFFKSAFY